MLASLYAYRPQPLTQCFRVFANWQIKCNGSQPCNGCSKRNASCTYGSSGTDSEEQRSPKRRVLNHFSGAFASSTATPEPRMTPKRTIPIHNPSRLHGISVPVIGLQRGQEAREQAVVFPEPEDHLEVRGTSFGGKDEEAVVESNPRLLEDPTGRVCKY